MSKVLVIYWSGTGNTEIMANSIAEGIKEAGSEAEVLPVSEAKPDMVDSYEKIAFGCSAMGDEELEETEFEPYFAEVESKLKDKEIALFGSYSWNDGEWMRLWNKRTIDDGAKLFQNEGLIVFDTPTDDDQAKCKEFGASFAKWQA